MATFVHERSLMGHRDWVTSLAAPSPSSGDSVSVVSASRDKTLFAWDKNGAPLRRLEGHTGFVEDVAISNNGGFVLSASWDKSLRLWNLQTGETTMKFLGHSKDALCAAFSSDNRQILSGGRDKQLRVWNVRGECLSTLPDGHTDWVSCVRFSPSVASRVALSAGWDNAVKVWNLSEFRCLKTLNGHSGYVTTLSISPDGSLCASGSHSSEVKLWDIESTDCVSEFAVSSPVNCVAFSPSRYWLCTATEKSVRLTDLTSNAVIAELVPEILHKGIRPECKTVCWSHDGSTLYCGYTDNSIRVWRIP